MSNRYSVKVYESPEKDGQTGAGTVVALVDSLVAVYADSGELAEAEIRKEVEKGTLASGRVYQICPGPSVPELIRSIAVTPEGTLNPVLLDPAAGLYNETRRVSLPDGATSMEKSLLSLSEVLGY